ncbi:MAG: hypothetical protein E6Q70_07215 [Pseudomonas monteilii]|nr:MAG: hypothetical protein E6Q70_07215 [Pseudomonas monteilii]
MSGRSYPTRPGSAAPVGAALCRERAAKRPRRCPRLLQDPGAAAQPDRDTRPLLQKARTPDTDGARPPIGHWQSPPTPPASRAATLRSPQPGPRAWRSRSRYG